MLKLEDVFEKKSVRNLPTAGETIEAGKTYEILKLENEGFLYFADAHFDHQDMVLRIYMDDEEIVNFSLAQIRWQANAQLGMRDAHGHPFMIVTNSEAGDPVYSYSITVDVHQNPQHFRRRLLIEAYNPTGVPHTLRGAYVVYSEKPRSSTPEYGPIG